MLHRDMYSKHEHGQRHFVVMMVILTHAGDQVAYVVLDLDGVALPSPGETLVLEVREFSLQF